MIYLSTVKVEDLFFRNNIRKKKFNIKVKKNMESRKITIIETKNQRKSTIMSSASTLAELKSDLTANGIDYSGMTFFEGTSKVELKNDASVLPHDVPYKGTITNELVFMLTNTNKKIKSGAIVMSRTEAYSAIKSMGLQDACIKKFGKNFTMCKTADLIALIQSNSASKPAPVNTPEASAPVASTSNGGKCVDTVARVAISKLVEILENNGTIEDYEKKEVLDILGSEIAVAAAPSKEYKPESASSYSDDEIDDMFTDMGVY